MIVTKRMRYLYSLWYQPDVYMSEDDWIYIACMCAGAVISLGLGFLIGQLVVFLL